MRWRAGDETQRATLRRACQRTPPGTAHSSKQSNSSILSHVLVLERELMKLGPSLEQVQVKSIHKQQTTIRKPIECAPEASSGGREWAEMTEGFHLEATRRKVLTYVPSEKK